MLVERSELCVAAMGLCVFRAQQPLRTFYLRKEGIAVLIPDNLEETIQHLRRSDTQCQEFLGKSRALSVEYFRILESLAPADRACLQQYLDLCEVLEDRTVQLVAAHYAIHSATAFVNPEL